MNMEEILKPFGSVEKPHTWWADVFGRSQQGFYRGGGATGNDDFCGNLSTCNRFSLLYYLPSVVWHNKHSLNKIAFHLFLLKFSAGLFPWPLRFGH